jgi:hypothetical protein
MAYAVNKPDVTRAAQRPKPSCSLSKFCEALRQRPPSFGTGSSRDVYAAAVDNKISGVLFAPDQIKQRSHLSFAGTERLFMIILPR